MRRNSAKEIALGGMLAALAMVIMCLGGLVPASTYVCPMLCALVLQNVHLLTQRCSVQGPSSLEGRGLKTES